MLYTATIKLNTPLLGDKMSQEGVRRFSRESRMSNAELPISSALWSWALAQAAQAVGVEITGEMFRVPESIKAPALHLYVRRWTDKRGKKRADQFEAVRAGAVLEVPILLFSEVPPGVNNVHVVDVESLTRILEMTGTMIGVSPWGSKFGYGRFKVASLTPSV